MLKYFICGRDFTTKENRVLDCTQDNKMFMTMLRQNKQEEIIKLVKESAGITLIAPVFIMVNCEESMEEQPEMIG